MWGPSATSAGATATPSATATPTVYPIPKVCPPAKELGQAWVGKPDWFSTIDAKLLDSEMNTPLPKSGCAYLYSQPGTSNSSSETFQRVMVWYFNMNRPGQATTAEISAWAKSAEGTPLTGIDPGTGKTTTDTTGQNFDLPDTFSGWSRSTVVQVSGEGSSFAWDQSILPAYTQGDQAKIDFSVNAAKAQAMGRACGPDSSSGATSNSDPKKALAQGLAASFTTTVVVTDDQGYTAQLKVQGKLEPFTRDVTDAPPGKMNAVSSSTVSGTVTNTTNGRQTKAPGASVMAVYPLNSAACTGYNGISVQNADWQKPSFCAVSLGSVSEATLSPDASQPLPETTAPQKLGTFPESGNAIAQLNSPVSVYLFFGNKGSISTETAWHGDKGCLAQREYGGANWNVPMDGWPDVICE